MEARRVVRMVIKNKKEKIDDSQKKNKINIFLNNIKESKNQLSFTVKRPDGSISQYSGRFTSDQMKGKAIFQSQDRTQELTWRATRSVQMEDLIGKWYITITAPDGTKFQPSVQIKKIKKKYAYPYQGTQGFKMTVTQLKLEKNHIRMRVEANVNNNKVQLDYYGRPYGNLIHGKVDYNLAGSTGTVPFTAERK